MVSWLPAAICAVATGALLLAEKWDHFTLRAVSKPIAALAFIVSAWSLGAVFHGLAGHILLVGLVLGAIGDVLLIPEDNGVIFKAGIASFGLSHVAYIAVFLTLGASPLGIATLLVGVPLGWRIWVWLRDTAGKLRRAVAGYIIIIVLMVASACGALIIEPTNPGRQVLLAAAVIFFLSDLCVARQRFSVKDVRNRYVGLPLYFGAQLLFGLGMSLT